ncbi:hypothetical protein RUM44_008264 [Polyplax serrata]|uniref:Integrator complex subunit 1 n=1 Tax=Polyplax serrata TaxID=468196 RepID=A0ABR1B816_POLSC
MDRGKNSQSRGKSKTQHFPTDLFALGTKSSGNESNKRAGLSAGSSERKREATAPPNIPILAKKAKVVGTPTPLGWSSPGTSSTASPSGAEHWEVAAVTVEPSEIVNVVLEAHQAGQAEKAAGVICGAIKSIKNNKWKPDMVTIIALIYLAKLKPALFSSELVTQALSILLKRDPQYNFKSKGNPTVAVLACNLLLRGYQEQKQWPTHFVKLYVEDAMSERIWVDQMECKAFANNITTAFNTKIPPGNINLLIPELGPLGMSRSESPVTVTIENEEDNQSNSSCIDVPTMPRYANASESIEQIVMEIQATRRQTPESVTRNYLKLLSSACGLPEVRLLASPRLEIWLQNPKLMKPAQELLLYTCINCKTHSAKDIQVIACLAKIRLKTKALINFYLMCIKELINAHPDNLSTLLKHTIYNELSTSRNPNNMAMIGVMFQVQSELSATLLADVFLELLLNRDDYHRPLRALLREIVRVLRYDINLIELCRGLMADKKDNPTFRDFEFKERMFYAVVDLIALSCFLGVSPAVKESVNLVGRGDKREIQTLINYHMMVSKIQQETVVWLKDDVPKIYRINGPEFLHALHKVLFMEQQDTYYKIDMWPPESERTLLLRLSSESPLCQSTLINVLFLGLSKDHPITAPDALELADQLVKRSALMSVEGLEMLKADKSEIFEMIFNVTAYHHPDIITLPQGYCPPRLAISNLYWKAWIMLLLLSVHNPSTLGAIAWEKYPMLRIFMEMCITNHFSYPPPTMNVIENSEETKTQELRLTAREKESILEFESHLAAASTKATITEQTSLLLPQLITMDPLGPSRKPPVAILEQLAALNATHRMGHLLCRSRHPDFLLDLIQRQGTSQSMPWLGDLVESSEGSLSHLPVQCLCEFLLSSSPPEKQGKSQQLIGHLQRVLTDPNQEPTAPSEVLEYLLRRLSSPHMNSRAQAIKGLKLVLSSIGFEDEPMELDGQPQDNSWLLRQLPLLPHFASVRPQVVLALRQACQVENDPVCISSYITFLALHTAEDDLTSLGHLVQDMAQLIVERSTIMAAIMPTGQMDLDRANTLHSLTIIFCAYLQKAREPRKDNYTWSESQDQILVTWNSGEESTLHILVVHAMIILLSYGPASDPGLFALLLETWFPEKGPPPKAYLVDTSEEALLIPDWLKLRMIRSGVDRLVDAALVDLDVPQLVLFIQSFGIPVSSMSKLLATLDRTDASLVAAAVFDKSYMAQLVQVQRRRGATGGNMFVQALQLTDQASSDATEFSGPVGKATLTLPPSSSSIVPTQGFHLPSVLALLDQLFSQQETSNGRQAALKKLQIMLLIDTKMTPEKIQGFGEIMNWLMTMTKTSENFEAGMSLLNQDPTTGAKLLRLLWKLCSTMPEDLKSTFITFCNVVKCNLKSTTPLSALIAEIQLEEMKVQKKSSRRHELKPEKVAEILLGTADKNSECFGQLIDCLVSIEPELISSRSEKEMIQLLFGKSRKPHETVGTVDAETCRPYLLTLLTHRASWGRLQCCVDHLLLRFEKHYSPTSVLDFLEAMTRNPRLWQGREKRIPKHYTPESVLRLQQNQVLCMIDYIIEEANLMAEEEGTSENRTDDGEDELRPHFLDTLEARLPILLEAMEDEFIPAVLRKLASRAEVTQSSATVCKHLLVLIYFHIPGAIKYLFGTEEEFFLKKASISGWSSSALDKISHTLLTALTANTINAKDWWKKSQDFELAARKMAVVHPALVLRQLPMLAASLQGRVHLDYVVLRVRNHITVFSQVLGLMELLQPKVFTRQYATPLHITLDAYMTLFKLHGHMKDVIPMVSRFVTFLQNFVANDASRAMKYLQANSVALSTIQRIHPDLTSLQSLFSGILSSRDENGEEIEILKSGVVTTPVEVVSKPPLPIVNALTKSQGEDILSALQELDHLSTRNPAILEVLTEPISSLILSPYNNIRTLSHTLLARLMKYNPQSNAVIGYLRCLESCQGEIAITALEKLPDMVVSAQEYAGLLLEKVFALGVRSSMNTVTYINKAIALLNLQSGC